MAGAGLHQYIEARFFQVGDYGWNQRHAPFFRINFPGYT
jgi:hypothetical protein